MSQKTFMEQVEDLLALGRPRVGVGLAEADPQVVASLQQAMSFCDVVLVGTSVSGFECRTTDDPERELARMLVAGEVGGIVRGMVDDFKTFEAYCDLAGCKKEECAQPALIEDALGRQFFLIPVSNPEGWSKEEKLAIAGPTIALMRSFGIKPKVGVLTGVRHDTYARRKQERDGVVGILNATYEDAEHIVEVLTRQGVETTNYAVEFSTAVAEGCNLVIEVNGMLGNHIFRALCLMGGGRLLIAPRLGLKHPFEDNSRNEKDLLTHVKYVAAWANASRGADGSRTG